MPCSLFFVHSRKKGFSDEISTFMVQISSTSESAGQETSTQLSTVTIKLKTPAEKETV